MKRVLSVVIPVIVVALVVALLVSIWRLEGRDEDVFTCAGIEARKKEAASARAVLTYVDYLETLREAERKAPPESPDYRQVESQIAELENIIGTLEPSLVARQEVGGDFIIVPCDIARRKLEDVIERGEQRL